MIKLQQVDKVDLSKTYEYTVRWITLAGGEKLKITGKFAGQENKVYMEAVVRNSKKDIDEEDLMAKLEEGQKEFLEFFPIHVFTGTNAPGDYNPDELRQILKDNLSESQRNVIAKEFRNMDNFLTTEVLTEKDGEESGNA